MANLSCGRVRHASIAPTVHTASAESFRYKSPALSDKPLTPRKRPALLFTGSGKSVRLNSC